MLKCWNLFLIHHVCSGKECRLTHKETNGRSGGIYLKYGWSRNGEKLTFLTKHKPQEVIRKRNTVVIKL